MLVRQAWKDGYEINDSNSGYIFSAFRSAVSRKLQYRRWRFFAIGRHSLTNAFSDFSEWKFRRFQWFFRRLDGLHGRFERFLWWFDGLDGRF